GSLPQGFLQRLFPFFPSPLCAESRPALPREVPFLGISSRNCGRPAPSQAKKKPTWQGPQRCPATSAKKRFHNRGQSLSCKDLRRTTPGYETTSYSATSLSTWPGCPSACHPMTFARTQRGY